MTQFVKLKKEKTSAKFGIVFPANVPLIYSSELKSLKHPKSDNVWIRVEENEIEKT